jgi:hypothetical protein
LEVPKEGTKWYFGLKRHCSCKNAFGIRHLAFGGPLFLFISCSVILYQ